MTERELADLLRRNPDIAAVGDGEPSAVATPPRLTEHELQAAVIAESDRRALLRPEYGLIFAIPNGGARHPFVAAKLKAEGVKAGVPDLFLPVARHGYHGLFVELKVTPGKPSEAQLTWIRNLKAEGYRCDVVWDSVDEVMARIEWYLET